MTLLKRIRRKSLYHELDIEDEVIPVVYYCKNDCGRSVPNEYDLCPICLDDYYTEHVGED